VSDEERWHADVLRHRFVQHRLAIDHNSGPTVIDQRIGDTGIVGKTSPTISAAIFHRTIIPSDGADGIQSIDYAGLSNRLFFIKRNMLASTVAFLRLKFSSSPHPIRDKPISNSIVRILLFIPILINF